MISRIADHCFWLGRYLERAESTSRLLQVTSQLALDADADAADVWWPVVIVCGEQEAFETAHTRAGAADGELVQGYFTWEEGSDVSLIRSVQGARWNARNMREVVSLEVWEATNELHLWLASDAARALYAEDRFAFFRRVWRDTQLVLGLVGSTMLQDEPADFVNLGVMLERANQTARLLDVHHHALLAHGHERVFETVLWLTALRACAGVEPFMKRAQGRVSGEAIAEFLVLEARFPRSIRFVLDRAVRVLERIRPPEATHLPGGQSLAQMRALATWLAGKRASDLGLDDLHDVLTHVVDETGDIAGLLGRELLGYAPPAGQQ